MTKLTVALVLSTGAFAATTNAAPPIQVVIVYVGGPDAGAEGQKLIDQLVAHLATTTGEPAGQWQGSYFTDPAAAAAHLAKHRDAFVLGGLGFFLSQRRALGLVPLARLATNGDGTERYYILAHKEAHSSLATLKGKTLWGSPLYEDPRFLEVTVFGGKLPLAREFVLKPTNRPLSALRKLEKQQGVDAVLLNSVQYEGLLRMPLYDKLKILYTSEPIPTLGFMMIDTPRTRELRDKILATVSGMCATEQGTPVCRNFGIQGFAPIAAAKLAPLITTYDQGQ